MVLILNGKRLSQELAEELKAKIVLINHMENRPKLAIVMVGDDAASEIYVRNKLVYAKQVGILTELIKLNKNASQSEIFDTVTELNGNDTIHGIIIQSPLPDQSYQDLLFDRVNADKDVDGFSAINIGKLCNGQRDCFVSCTPLGILTLLERNNISLAGQHVVILGRSRIVGRPLSILLSQKFENCNATVTLCHSGSKNLTDIAKTADVLITAIGKPKFVSKEMVKEGAVLVDVGITKAKDNIHANGYKLYGDIDFDDVYCKCSAITPVPGGVGPMTVAMLMQNTFQAYTKLAANA
ncbi:MAG: bifunctional 5,10-methylenetetrahydrofolate dehydrogenase/5,10-methenyltetrahydrofolate cyclohydrolase [Puniceicoccales bacterium]|jgi:methylenetetrahydrofolate dehydrogenase (NADP+)/methenyltetrahydrofolate cyclohydrolase|nr:bifunctional 5,10-methylenetetrahydrofolate dehydrogenase/5,10-methenyltetrahydrofolate cyclohydrolase [Puniceicoccales bacterium]